MEVETFECSETITEPIEATEEAVSILESLGLDGQLSLVKRTESGHDQRCPYREITADESFVYRTLCPTETPIERYNASPIPLRVLQIAAHAKETGMFEKLLVWDRASATVKDPVLVGQLSRYEPGQSWKTTVTYILARWGSELETFSTLLRQALDAKRESRRSALRSIAAKSKAALDAIDMVSDEDLMAGSEPYAHGIN